MDENTSQASDLDIEVANQQQAADLRLKITEYATGAVNYGGVDRDWANSKLRALGAQVIEGSNAAEYRLNVPITGLLGVTVYANSRTEAKGQFAAYLENLDGKVVDCYRRGFNVYGIELQATEPTFYSGPEDPDQSEAPPVLTLDELKTGIRAMIREGVAEQGWAWSHGRRQFAAMGLGKLPDLTYRTVEIPVTGTTKVGVRVFEDDTDERVLEAVKSKVVGMGSVSVKPDEMGTPVVPE